MNECFAHASLSRWRAAAALRSPRMTAATAAWTRTRATQGRRTGCGVERSAAPAGRARAASARSQSQVGALADERRAPV